LLNNHTYFRFVVSAVVLLVVSCNDDNDVNPYIVSPCSGVLEYTPAPGQFIGDGFEAATPEDACSYAFDRLNERKYVSLGGYGGYIIAKLSKRISPGGIIVVCGNPTESSSEPGIVYYMDDNNGNGLPDDGAWIEVEGSLHGTDEEQHGYSVTYYRPTEENSDVRWTDSDGEEGHILRNDYHKQASYYPAWIDSGSYTLSGIRLKCRAYDSSGDGSMWINPTYGSGYADNYSKDYPELRKNINSRFGNKVIPDYANIFRIDSHASFVKVQNSINASCGWIGEVSTEVFDIFAIAIITIE